MAVTARKRIRERKENESLENEESQCKHSKLGIVGVASTFRLPILLGREKCCIYSEGSLQDIERFYRSTTPNSLNADPDCHV